MAEPGANPGGRGPTRQRDGTSAPLDRGEGANRGPEPLARRGARALPDSDPDYPAALRDLADPPGVVYLRGTLPERAGAVAVVGSRAASPYGIERARDLAARLAGLGVAVVSGLARGIDAAAHRGALEAGGRTVAVLPGGLDAIAPRHHRALAEEIAARGGLLTEVASGEPAWPSLFLRRNRLIAALGVATVVVEAAERSGSLSTAAAARRLGRPVLAVPGDVDRPTSRGCHALIRAGALLCEGVADVLRAIGADAAAQGTAAARVLQTLAAEPRPAESLAAAAGLALDEALAALLELEWASLAVPHPGQRWSRSAASGP